MPRSTQKTDQKQGADFSFPQIELMAFNGSLFSAYAQAGQAFFENAMALNQEVMRFTNDRLQASAQVLHELPGCTSWEEAATIQADFVRAATEAYLAEMPKLTEQAAKTCTAMCTPIFETAQAAPEGGTMGWTPQVHTTAKRPARAQMSHSA